MKSIEFSKERGEIRDVGALHTWLDRNLRWLKNGRHALVLKGVARKRSVAQNRLMWMWFSFLEHEFGTRAQVWHDYYCKMFLPTEFVNPVTGEVTMVGGHTSTLTVEAFSEFLDKVQADVAAEFGATLPSPEDETWGDFEEEVRRYAE